MRTEREKEAREIRAGGEEEARKVKATADKERKVILAEARKTAELMKGKGDAEAIEIVSKSFGKDPEFYEFYRSLEAYRSSLNGSTDTMVLSPDSNFMKYFNNYR